jgi:hypothetical protein
MNLFIPYPPVFVFLRASSPLQRVENGDGLQPAAVRFFSGMLPNRMF